MRKAKREKNQRRSSRESTRREVDEIDKDVQLLHCSVRWWSEQVLKER